jgi:DMSO/TMAO reductase YedYZ heme-binding membrane subunit
MDKSLERRNCFSSKVIIVIFLFSLLYSIVRYHIYGGVPWKEFPIFIMNKVVSLNGIILLIITFSITPLKNLGVKVPANWLKSRKALGMTGFIFVFIHMVMSFLLFSPAYYSKFFEDSGRMTLNSSLSMLFGVLAFIVLWFYNLSFYKQGKDKEITRIIKSRNFLLLVMPFTALHLFFMGYKGWGNPSGWHAGIPPISLVAFIFFTVGYLINILGRK